MPHAYARYRNAAQQKGQQHMKPTSGRAAERELAGMEKQAKGAKHYRRGGQSIFDQGVANVEGGKSGVIGGRAARAAAQEEALKAEGKSGPSRLDKRARGGGLKKPRSHRTNINIAIGSPPNPDASVLGPMGGPLAQPMVPRVPMGPRMGGLGAGAPGFSGANTPGMMRRGGKVGMTAGADSAEGRLEKKRAALREARRRRR
jgi:hypothetical protein